MRILVVDDHRDVADSMGLLLRAVGHEVRKAYGGREALDTAAGFHPEVIFLDLMMPIVDGFEVARRIRAEPWGKDILLVALTALEGEQLRHRTQEIGFNYYFVKPVELATISALLKG